MDINSVKDDEHVVSSSKVVTLLRLFAYLLKYKKQILLVLAIMSVTVTVTIVNPLIIERAIDVYVSNKDKSGLMKLGIFACIINIIFVLLVKVRMYIMAKITGGILLTVRQELYVHIQTLSFKFFDSRPTGKILARIIGDVNSLKDVLANSVTTLIPDFITIIAVVVIMFSKNVQLALASLISLPLLILFMWLIQIYSHKKWQLHRVKSSNLNAFIHEDISGMRIIQSFSAEEETQTTFDHLLKEHRDTFMDAVKLNNAFGSAIDFCWGLGNVSLYYVAIMVLGITEVNVGTLIAFTAYISMFWRPLMNLSNFYNQLVTNITGAERIFEILDTKADILDGDGVIELPNIQGRVTFDNVSFEYDEDSKVLEQVSFHIDEGETIALVGPTGAGKTTIVNLISRFYDPTKGVVSIDGYDIKHVSLESLRRQMGVMTQDNFLFSGTIRDNLKYGNLDASDDDMISACKAVNAHEFIDKLEKGYDTELKERGSGLSVGQKQLLAFARTLISNPRILILDEATSSIDTHTELLVQKGIDVLLKNRTSFVIAHRLSTIQKANRIFVIDEGGIKEQGTAKELIAQQGLYYQLYMAQFKNI